MALPIALQVGMVACYGNCQSNQSSVGLIMPPSVRFGTIYHIWEGGTPTVQVGDNVMFNESDVQSRIVTEENLTFTIVPARLATKEPIPL